MNKIVIIQGRVRDMFIRCLLSSVLMMGVVGCTIVTTPSRPQLSTMSLQSPLTYVDSVRLGMTTDEVKAVMGLELLTGYKISDTQKESITIPQPYRSEEFQSDHKTYQVLYYFTTIKQADDVVTDDELTPLIFQNGKLVAKTWETLHQLKAKK